MLGTKMLVIDDDVNICELIKVYFQNEGYEVTIANDGIEGMNLFKSYDPDIVLLDLMLPKKDGTDICREIRATSNKPMIMITAKGDVFDKVLGLELGADDFVVKPFDMKELLARVKAVLRRYSTLETHVDKDTLRFDNIEISLANHELKIKGENVDIPHFQQGASKKSLLVRDTDPILLTGGSRHEHDPYRPHPRCQTGWEPSDHPERDQAYPPQADPVPVR